MKRTRSLAALAMAYTAYGMTAEAAPSAGQPGSTTLALKAVPSPRAPSLRRILEAAERVGAGLHTLLVAGRPVEILVIPAKREPGGESRRVIVRAT